MAKRDRYSPPNDWSIEPGEVVFERLPEKIDWKRESPWGKDDPNAEKRIIEAADAAGISAFNHATMPYLAGPYTVGRKVDIGRYVRGEEKCMLRDKGRNDPSKANGIRIFVQLSAICYESHEDILKRAVAALAVAEKLREQGRPVEVIATWSGRGDANTDKVAVVWKTITDASAKQLADLTCPSYFRSVVFGWWHNSGRSEHKKQGIVGGGCTYPIRRYEIFRQAIKSMRQDGDVTINWDLNGIEAQIADGVSQVA